MMCSSSARTCPPSSATDAPLGPVLGGRARRSVVKANHDRVAEVVRSRQSGRCGRGCCSCACYSGVRGLRWGAAVRSAALECCIAGSGGQSWPCRSAWLLAFQSESATTFRRASASIRPTYAGSSRSCKTTSRRSTFAPCLEEPRWRARVPSRAAQTLGTRALPRPECRVGAVRHGRAGHTVRVGELRGPA